MSRDLGQPFMPWQQLVAEIGGELLPTGLPAYRTVVLTVPRQSGKTTLVLSWELQRCVGWGKPQAVAYSAQTGNDARKKLIHDQVPLLERKQRALGIRRILRGMGNEAVEFASGSRITLLASAEESGHGGTLDLAVKDEFFADIDDRRDQAIIPAMSTRADAQVLTLSTAGTADSVPLFNLVERGRAAALEGRTDGIAYFEWSAEPEADIDDPDTWWGCMPALGITVTEEVVRDARESMSEAEFRRAFLNQWTTVRADRVISATAWEQVRDPDSKCGEPLVFAFDVTPDRSAASIAASDGRHVEVVEHHPGTGWLPPRLAEMVGKHHAVEVGCDPAGPAGALIADCKALGIEVREVSGREHAQACGSLVEAVTEQRLRHIGQHELDTAIDGAVQRQMGDVWLWSRKSSAVDISPLVAVGLARWLAIAAATTQKPVFAY